VARFDPDRHAEFLQSLNPRREEMKRRFDSRRLPFAVAIDNPDKEMNIGNLMRTAHSFLCSEIVLIGSARYEGSGSHGVERWESIRHISTREAFLSWLPESGYAPVAVEIHPASERLDRFTFPGRPIFLLGSELHGLDERLIAACPHKVMVPQFGMVPCLNVNISCSIVLYSYVTRCHPHIDPTPVRGHKFFFDEGSGRPQRKEKG
jgi:tRNA G18 (ribose-2'-O)-methylase SpoU